MNRMRKDSPSLRDIFAMHALAGIVNSASSLCTDFEASEVAGDAYKIADEMLKERKKKPFLKR